MVLYFLFHWSGTPVHSQLVFCMHLCVWRCTPDVSGERDVLHVHLLLHHLVLSKDRSWWVSSLGGKGGRTQAWDSQAGSEVHITELITPQPAPPWGKQKSFLLGVVTQAATSFCSPAIDFCISISYSAMSLDSLISSNNFLVEFTIFYILDHIISRDYFTFFFSVGCLFIP